MRLEAQSKLGYYAAAPEALDLILDRVSLKSGTEPPYAFLDPCAGEGKAADHLTRGLGIPQKDVHLIELSDTRGEACRELLPEAKVLAPASFFGCAIRSSCFSIVYCNPPFDDALGGGRLESRFLNGALHALAPGGILVFVAPERVQKQTWFATNIVSFCKNLTALYFPDKVRKYGEMIFIAERRGTVADPRRIHMSDILAHRSHQYVVPSAHGPGSRFQKTAPTDEEILEALERSPLNRLLAAPKPAELKSPPMQLGNGHLALLLASGYLDGIVAPEGEPPHVVRGVARKTEVLTESTEERTGKRETTRKDIYSERIDLIVRAIDASGVIRTFSSGGPTSGEGATATK